MNKRRLSHYSGNLILKELLYLIVIRVLSTNFKGNKIEHFDNNCISSALNITDININVKPNYLVVISVSSVFEHGIYIKLRPRESAVLL